MGKYDDIINLSRPKSNRPSMSVADRAKIFMPFAALKGYEEAIEEKQKLMTSRMELSEEKKEELDVQLHELSERLADGRTAEVTVRYYVKDERASQEEQTELGNYVDVTGKVKKIDTFLEQIIVEEQTIALKDIFYITIV